MTTPLDTAPRDSAAQRLIPGAYEPRTPASRQPGAMAGAAFGSDTMPAGPSTMSSETIAERRKEGGALRSAILVAIVLSLGHPAFAADAATYRQFTLGASTMAVLASTAAAAADLKTLHERPALLQELSWRPPFTVATERDPVSGIVFRFIDDHLSAIVVDYDRGRTEGLTSSDLIESLSTIYGPRSKGPVAARSRSAVDALDTPTVIARWREGETSITLQQFEYSGAFELVVASVPLEIRARKAEAAALVMDAREAPQRDAARARTEAAAAKALAEKTRTTNKAAFTP